MDNIDQANETTQQEIDRIVYNARKNLSNPIEVDCCMDCGEIIPEKRKQVIPGCVRCVKCQEEMEKIMPY